jgi:hypothetical protein
MRKLLTAFASAIAIAVFIATTSTAGSALIVGIALNGID